MSSPFASAPVAAPKGATVAWLENNGGQRNIWIASGPEWKARQLTSFTDDDGQEIADVSWMPDASSLLFVRGGDSENGGENPNPSLNPVKPDQSIWRVELAGGAPSKVTEGQGPAISPQGQIVFLRKDQVFLLKDGHEAVPLLEQKGSQSNLKWSPDGTRVAFVSGRLGHSFIGVFTLADHSIRYLDPSIDRDSEPAWSPDGSSIAFLRIPAQNREASFSPHRSGPPWSIRVADVRSGEGHETFRAQTGRGSVFHPVEAEGQILWAGDRFLFPWERSGWVHLYSLPVSGGTSAVDLTPGEGEVEHVALSKDRKEVFYSTNIGDIDRRHIGSAAVDGSGSKSRLLTEGETIEWQPAPAADGSALFFLSSSYNRTAHAEVRGANGERRALSPEPPASFPSALLVKPKPVLITAADGLQLHGQIFLPAAGGPETRHPALIFFHGGSRRQMLLGYHYMYYYSNAYSLNQYLASRGYVVLAVNYRSGIGYGLDFREAIHYGAQGGSEFNDVMGAGVYLKSRADVDPNRIGVWGGSYGGYLTAMALSRASDLFAAGVDFHGVHDWSSLRGYLTGGEASGDPDQVHERQDAARVAFESSPMASVDTWRSPVLLIHGDDDRNVEFGQTLILAEALRRRGVTFEQLIFPNEIHDFLLHRHWVQAYEATADFFARKLKEPVQTANK